MPTKWYTAFLRLFFIAAVLYSSLAFAREPLWESASVYRYNYGFISLFGQGQMGNKTFEAPQRNMDFTTYQAFLGFRVHNYRYSIVGEYAYVAQKTNVEIVSNTNLTGQSYAYGPKFEYYDGKQSIGIIYRAKSAHRLSKLDLHNKRQYYGAKLGFNIQYTRRIKNKFGIVVDYAREEYGESLSDKIKWDRISVGLVISNFDKHPYPLPDPK